MQDFDTRQGKNLTHQLTEVSKHFNLSYTYGHSPQSYFLTRYPASHPRSVFSLLTTKIFPSLLTRPDRPNPLPLFLFNSGSARFDIGKGPFTVDSQSLVFPFINRNLFVPDVPIKLARHLSRSMNKYGEYYNSSAVSCRQAIEEREELLVRDKMALRYQAALEVTLGESEPTSYG